MDIDRTTALGLFNTARSYWRSAVTLHQAQLKVTHPSAPITFLFCHAIELYLKSQLRCHGYDLGKLKGIGHNISRLGEEAAKTGLPISTETTALLSHIKEEDVAMDARYIVTGFKSAPTAEFLADACKELDHSIGAELIAHGQPVHMRDFVDPPAPSVDLDADTVRVLIDMFGQPNSDHSDARYLAARLKMDPGIAQYHLDELAERDLVNLGGFNMNSGDNYWSLTTKGRAYVVRNKLVPSV
ncbi:hypothetical protein IC762_17890 [Bradyrhizobium genosp. L]|uniref:hypothetical protein n=1 Tax=Bradyrhizobium genosp. L TaxID=83637 RepID=UPI0018A2DA03|nr:hypothetical protein [Bradyrhizobium genosp. L]QPF81695.1 hypothetical protein IC762_17890 [Bradyrhizobium genosp. L]